MVEIYTQRIITTHLEWLLRQLHQLLERPGLQLAISALRLNINTNDHHITELAAERDNVRHCNMDPSSNFREKLDGSFSAAAAAGSVLGAAID